MSSPTIPLSPNGQHTQRSIFQIFRRLRNETFLAIIPTTKSLSKYDPDKPQIE